MATTSDPVVGHARVCYSIPVRRSELETWTTADPDDHRWAVETEKAIRNLLPDLLDRAGEPDVEFD
jgi:hypothetical protein